MIINIVGVSRAGKGTLANILHDQLSRQHLRVERFKFSSPMKRWFEETYGLYEGAFEVPEVRSSKVPGHPDGITYLDLMIRASKHLLAIDPRIMTLALDPEVRHIIKWSDVQIFDDCRFPAEVDYLLDLQKQGHRLINVHIYRSGTEALESDRYLLPNCFRLSSLSEFHTLPNLGSLGDLERSTQWLVDTILNAVPATKVA